MTGYSGTLLARKPAHPVLLRHQSLGQEAVMDQSLVFDERVFWGCTIAKLQHLAPHYWLMGTTGSGKTTLLKMLMMSVFCDASGQFPLKTRGLVYDPKPEYLTALRAMGIPADCLILPNPFERRSSAWNVAADVTHAAQAEALAEIIVPTQTQDTQRGADLFWTMAAHQVVEASIQALILRAPGNWDFRDLATACLDETVREHMLGMSELGRATLKKFFQADGKHGPGIDAQIVTHVGWLLKLGNLWRRAENRFSFTGWSRGTGIIIVSRFADAPVALTRTNNMLLQWACQTILSRPEGPDQTTDATWMFIDELSGLGKFPGFGEYLQASRGKGAHNVLAFQESAGLASSFAEHEIRSLINQCGNRGVLAMNDYREAEFASKLFDSEEAPKTSRTYAQSREVSSTTHLDTRPVVPPEAIQRLRLVRQLQGGVEGYFHTRVAGTFRNLLDATRRARILADVDRADNFACPSFEPRPPSHQTEAPWTAEDSARLGVASVPGSTTPLLPEKTSLRRPSNLTPLSIP